MAKHLTNLSGLRVGRDGLTKESFKAHIAEIQQQLRDLQEELRQATGGGKSQVPAKKQAFTLDTSASATSKANLAAQRSLRTTTKSRASDDLVTRRELAASTAQASTATGFMDLLTDQVVVSGDKDFGSISFQRTFYSSLAPGSSYPAVDLSGATVFELAASSASAGTVTIQGIQDPGFGAFRILIWRTYTSNLALVHKSSAAAVGAKIETLTAASSATVDGPTISTVGPGAFILWYNTATALWTVIARNA